MTKAIFLSYASQDADAAHRITEALRAAGLEVWFDQSELRGGDAWDGKIRRQIKECGLFMPVISANTESRLEGYFRREWRAAVDRMHDMDDDMPFLVPVVIDDTPDASARVPERFRERQWTRLPGGDTPSEFIERVQALASGAVVSPRVRSPAISLASGSPPRQRKKPDRTSWLKKGWLILLLAGVAAAVLLFGVDQHREGASPAQQEAQVSPAASSQTIEYVAKARELLARTELARAELVEASRWCELASKIDPEHPDVWSTWAQVDAWFAYHGFDRTPERRKAASVKVERAMRLAPEAFESRLAQALFLVRGGDDSYAPAQFATEAERTLRELLEERPDEPRVLFTLAVLLRNAGSWEESAQVYDRLASNPRFAAIAWCEKGWMLVAQRRYAEALDAANRSVALQPFWINLVLKTQQELRWLGDLEAAEATLSRIPAVLYADDFVPSIAFEVFRYARKPDRMLKTLDAVHREWLTSNHYNGPKAFLVGQAHAMAGRTHAAEIQWRAALVLVEEKLTRDPTSRLLLYAKGDLQLGLEQTAEAEKTYRLAGELSENSVSGNYYVARTRGDRETAIEFVKNRRPTAAVLRLNPDFDWLRDHPAFIELQARSDADPQLSPKASEPGGTAIRSHVSAAYSDEG